MQLYGLIGYPLGHSFSKQYFTEKFQREKLLDCNFENFAIPAIEELAGVLKNNPQLKGLSVTIPYKQQVLVYATQLSPEVKFIGAANCIKISGANRVAYNTDIIGFEKSFTPMLRTNHKKALILGTGGAAKAVQYVLKNLGIEFLTVTRTKDSPDGYINYNQLDADVMDQYTIIINCSPVGTSPNDAECPAIPYKFITANHYLYDLVYKPAETLFLKKGVEQAAQVKNGYEMLLIQAEANWLIWNKA